MDVMVSHHMLTAPLDLERLFYPGLTRESVAR